MLADCEQEHVKVEASPFCPLFHLSYGRSCKRLERMKHDTKAKGGQTEAELQPTHLYLRRCEWRCFPSCGARQVGWWDTKVRHWRDMDAKALQPPRGSRIKCYVVSSFQAAPAVCDQSAVEFKLCVIETNLFALFCKRCCVRLSTTLCQAVNKVSWTKVGIQISNLSSKLLEAGLAKVMEGSTCSE
eukprot:3809345-Amphidinium_carterae.1